MAQLARKKDKSLSDIYDETGHPNPSPETKWNLKHPEQLRPKNASLFEASAWMTGITLALFIFPGANGFIGGLVGGSRAGSVSRALTAALWPAIICTAATAFLLTSFDDSVARVLSGPIKALVSIAVGLGILFGAWVGGRMAQQGMRLQG